MWYMIWINFTGNMMLNSCEGATYLSYLPEWIFGIQWNPGWFKRILVWIHGQIHLNISSETTAHQTNNQGFWSPLIYETCPLLEVYIYIYWWSSLVYDSWLYKLKCTCMDNLILINLYQTTMGSHVPGHSENQWKVKVHQIPHSKMWCFPGGGSYMLGRGNRMCTQMSPYGWQINPSTIVNDSCFWFLATWNHSTIQHPGTRSCIWPASKPRHCVMASSLCTSFLGAGL